MKLVTRPALKRIGVLFIGLGALVTVSWWTMMRMPGRSFRGLLPALNSEETALRDELRHHVNQLADKIGERSVFMPVTLAAAANYIESTFTKAGYRVERQSFQASGETCDNLVAEIAGAKQREQIIVIGAHYDSVSGTVGANDNASGVAGVLALARLWADRTPDRTIRFVAFANEEPPFFQTAQMGSLVYAKRCRERKDNIVAMLSLETIGYYSTKKGSQKYPPPMGLFYPSTGDFIGFVGNHASADLVRRCVESFRRQVSFPCEGGAMPGWLSGVGWSDHWSFWQAGYPGVMVTDTAPFRYPYYHTVDDTPNKLDYDRSARVVSGLDKVLAELAGQ